jgi:hypothetical protein
MKHLVAGVVFMAVFISSEWATAQMICLFKSEQILGTKKICYYDCGGSIFSITIDGLQLCPLSIRK